MFATIRRYEAVDSARTPELVKQADETLIPRLEQVPGFGGYYLIDAGNGVLSSIGLFDSAEHADLSSHVAADWVREHKLEEVLPDTPKVTTGEVVAHKTPELVQA
jgi:hypothetical protein